MSIVFPKISLVTPSLNQGKFVRATLDSVLSQGYPELDYRVQDGGSTDGTVAVLREFEARVPFLSEKDRGQADAINRGLSKATGEILGYLNSDDVLLPGALAAVGEAFASDPELVFVWGRASYVDEAGGAVSPYLARPDAIERLADACFIAQPAAFFRRKVWDEIGPFDETLHHTMDYDYWLRIAARYPRPKMRFLDRELAGCRMHADAKTVAGWSRALDEIFALVKKHTGYVSLWWCVAKWDHRIDGRSQATDPHPVPWRAYPAAIVEFLRRNPGRPDVWWRGVCKALGGVTGRLRAGLSRHRSVAGLGILLGCLSIWTPVGAAGAAPAVNLVASIAGARGDWPQWRGNPQHTGYQALPGRIVNPRVKWREYLGGVLSPTEVFLSAGARKGERGSLVVASGGTLRRFTSDGDLLWDREWPGNLRILGIWDLEGTGAAQILASSLGFASTSLFLFDVSTGDLLWTSPSVAGQMGGVKVADLGLGKGLQIVWLPAASSVIRAYAFGDGVRHPRLMWKTRLKDFVTDPYGYSALAIRKTGKSRRRQIVIAGGRHSIPVLFLDAVTGEETGRREYRGRVKGVESGGERQMLQLADVDGTGSKQIVSISDHLLADGEMFHGLMVTRTQGDGNDRILDTHPEGLHFAQGSIRERERKGAEAVISRYSLSRRRHDLMVLDVRSLKAKAKLKDFALSAILPEDNGHLIVLGRVGAGVEKPLFEGRFTACRYDGSAFREFWEAAGRVTLAGIKSRSFGMAEVDNEGTRAVTLPREDGGLSILAFRGDRPDRRPELTALDLATGYPVATFVGHPGTQFTLLDSFRAAEFESARIALSDDDGSLFLLDGKLNVVRQVRAGTYRQNLPSNGHSTEVAIVSDLSGGRRKDVIVIDSLRRVLRLNLSSAGCPEEIPTTIWSSKTSQDLLAFPNGGGGHWLSLSGVDDLRPSLNVVDGDGRVQWTHMFTGETGSPPEDMNPVGFNYGRFGPNGRPGVVCSGGSSKIFPRRTFAFDAASGRMLWDSKVGTYWDATIALGDVNEDGSDDILINADTNKCRVLSGKDGRMLVEPAFLPVYRNLSDVDYNGALIVVGTKGRDLLVVNAEDDAHLALLAVPLRPGRGARTRVLWAAPQVGLDEERHSMAALAPSASGGWLVGVGSRRGVLRVLRGPDGASIWNLGLKDGRILRAAPSEPNPLSSVLSIDVDGDGRVEFVVGGTDGWLYALDAETGSLKWSLYLGAPAGDPIAADFEGGGFAEILVPTADGYLNAVGP